MDWKKKRVKRWCKYWHFNVIGVLQPNGGHQNYLSIVHCLEDWHGIFWDDSNPEHTIEFIWPLVLKAINKCSDEQIDFLEKRCNTY